MTVTFQGIACDHPGCTAAVVLGRGARPATPPEAPPGWERVTTPAEVKHYCEEHKGEKR